MNANRIIDKPWGSEEVIEINEKYMVKKLTMNKGHRCSLQFHNVKKETIYVLSGELKITVGTKIEELSDSTYTAGQTITIEPGLIHRMEAVSHSVYLEASTSEMDDVVRLDDDYKREHK